MELGSGRDDTSHRHAGSAPKEGGRPHPGREIASRSKLRNSLLPAARCGRPPGEIEYDTSSVNVLWQSLSRQVPGES